MRHIFIKTLGLICLGLAMPVLAEAEVQPDSATLSSLAPDGPALAHLVFQAQAGDFESQVELGRDYRDGFGLPKDQVRAAAWFRMGANAGYAPAQVSLADMYLDGDGFAQDCGQAKNLMQQAADQGFEVAQLDLGNMYADGRCVPQDNVQAYTWLQLSAKSGDEAAGKARDVVAGKMTSAQVASAAGLAKAWTPAAPTTDQQALAIVSNNDIDDGERIARLTPLASGGNTLAQVLLGTAYGMGGQSDLAAQWLHKAVEKGSVMAQMTLAIMCLNGAGPAEDEDKVVGWLQNAAAHKMGMSEYYLGLMNLSGKYVPQDIPTGVGWLQKAADQGIANAQYNMGNLYAQGEGVPQDWAQAYTWVGLAKLYGSDPGFEASADAIQGKIAAQMNAAQLRQARSRIETWHPTFPIPEVPPAAE